MKSKKKIKNNRIKKEKKIFVAMDKSCLLNHCLPEYLEYQEQIPNHYKIGSKSRTTHIKTKKNKQTQIMKSLEKCSKKNCSK